MGIYSEIALENTQNVWETPVNAVVDTGRAQ